MQWQAILPIVQYALFPFFCAAFYFLRLKSYRIPRVALLLALVGGTVSFVELYLPAIGPARAAVMSPLEGDTIQSQSRKLRERINADLHTLGQSQVKGISRRVKNHEEAMKLVGSAGLKALVWGNTRWVRVAFAEQAPASLVEIRDRQEFMSLNEIRLVTSVPSIGLPYEPRNETANFLAGVVGGVSSGFAGSMSTVEAARREMLLRDTGQLVSFWGVSSHRALAWWGLGNVYAFHALQQPEIDYGELRCAIAAYRKARGFLRSQDTANRDLLIAIINNRAVVRMIEQLPRKGPGALIQGKKLLSPALKLAKKPSPYSQHFSAGSVARLNWQILKAHAPDRAGAKHGRRPTGAKRSRSEKHSDA